MPGPRQTYHVSESDMKKRLGGIKGLILLQRIMGVGEITPMG